jgi:hypothetical protein
MMAVESIAEQRITVEVLRYRPEQDAAPVMESYEIPYIDGMSVLQALQYIKDCIDGTLSFRWSCRMAICGSCGMMIDGKPQLACQTILRAGGVRPLRVEPLKHFPIERDLVVTVSDFVSKIESIYPFIIPRSPRTPAEGEYLQTPAEMARFEISAIASTACCATRPVRSSGRIRIFWAQARSHYCSATMAIPAMPARINEWSSCTPKTAPGAAPQLAIARTSARSMSIQPMRSTRTRPIALWTSSSGSCRGAVNPSEVVDAPSLPTSDRFALVG